MASFSVSILALIVGVVLGVAWAGDIRNERIALCMKNNATLELCASINGWDIK